MESQRLKEIRRSLKITQTELAGLIDVHPQMISKWETGSVPMKNYYRSAILELFGKAGSKNPTAGRRAVHILKTLGISKALYSLLKEAFLERA